MAKTYENFGGLKAEHRAGHEVARVYVQISGQDRIDWVKEYAAKRGVTEVQVVKMLVNEVITARINEG